jgi:hypothetical protein
MAPASQLLRMSAQFASEASKREHAARRIGDDDDDDDVFFDSSAEIVPVAASEGASAATATTATTTTTTMGTQSNMNRSSLGATSTALRRASDASVPSLQREHMFTDAPVRLRRDSGNTPVGNAMRPRPKLSDFLGGDERNIRFGE